MFNRFRSTLVQGFLAGLMLAPAAGWAGLTFCNETAVTQTVAIGHKDGDNWISRGWWNIKPGDCATPVGEDLRYRYYYYRAEATGRTFSDENYVFCTQRSAFAITGDENCQDRGYERSKFRRIDTGEKNTSFTLTLVESKSSPPPAPPPAPRSSGPAAPGTYGEPYSSGTAYMQDCITETEAPFCTFLSDGTKFFVYDDGRSPSVVFAIMSNLLPGTPIDVTGDLESIYDATADVVLRDVTVRPWTRFDGMMNRLQGQWYSVEDPNSQFTVYGAERETQYDGRMTGMDFVSIQNWCDNYSGDTYLYARDPETQDYYCYQVIEISDWAMTLMYLPGGNFLDYRKLD